MSPTRENSSVSSFSGGCERWGDLAPSIDPLVGQNGAWAESLPLTAAVEAEPHQLYVLHVLDDLDLVPEAAGFSAVISGHSHQPRAETRRGVLYLNPGSAGPRRFRLPVTVARLVVTESGVEHEIVELTL